MNPAARASKTVQAVLPAPLLEIRHLHRRFGGLDAVKDLSLSLEEGTIRGIIGPNGAGKTTLFNLISGTFPPSSGEVLFRGEEITGEPPHRIAARGILRTFQALKLSRSLPVLDNVLLGCHTRGTAGFFQGLLGLPRGRREEKDLTREAMSVMEELDIARYASVPAGSLPFGIQRTVELARALAAGPRLLLLDEPASGLNMQETDLLADQIRKIRNRGLTVLLVEHDMTLVMDICDSITVLNFGQLIASGTPGEIQKNPDVLSIYLGEEDA